MTGSQNVRKLKKSLENCRNSNAVIRKTENKIQELQLQQNDISIEIKECRNQRKCYCFKIKNQVYM